MGEPNTSSSGCGARALAFYLPQFHPIPENDAWWEPGFTEWTNVTRARPRFDGHYQPHLPADLGFYDLRLPEIREAQAALARRFGIDAFVYYRYWFDGRELLERPLREVLESGQPDFPFCICWANENWSRTWSGSDQELLVRQSYSEDDDRRHLRALLPFLTDPRYVRVDGKPLVLVYRVTSLPDAARTADVWRAEAALGGLELHLVLVQSFGDEVDPQSVGFDGAVAFAPSRKRLGRRLGMAPVQRVTKRLIAPSHPFRLDEVSRYEDLVANTLARPQPEYRQYGCVTPSWDNSARRARAARIVHGSTPDHYRAWVTAELDRDRPRTRDDHLLFVNAWNEWAEGAHLEPDQRWGHAYLEAHREGCAVHAARHPASS